MTDLTIRRYESAAAAAVWELHERALRDSGAYDPDLTHLDEDLQRIEEAYLDEGGEFLVGVLGAELVAMGGYRPLDVSGSDGALPLDFEAVLSDPDSVVDADPDSAVVIKRLRVDPDHYRRGFGTRVMDELEPRARRADFETVVPDTTVTQEAAVAFYEARGYDRVAREETDHGTVLCYRYQLGQ